MNILHKQAQLALLLLFSLGFIIALNGTTTQRNREERRASLFIGNPYSFLIKNWIRIIRPILNPYII